MQFNLRERRTWLLIVVVLAVSAIALAMFNGKVFAADKGGKPAAAPAAAPAVASWTGFGVDVHGALPTATLDGGYPINASIDGQMVGLGVFYNHQFVGSSIVVGVDANYDRLFGDLQSFAGVDYAVTLGLRAGVLVTNSTLIYARGEWLRAVGSGDHVDGWGFGGGIEVRIKDAPVSLALEYMHDWMDKDAFGPGVDVTADRVTARIKFDMYNKPVKSIFVD